MSVREGWGVALSGHRFDLADCLESLPSTFDPWIEKIDEKYVLRSTSFEGVQSAEELKARADALLPLLNGAMAVWHGARPVSFNGAVLIDAAGAIHSTIFPSTGTIEIRSRARAVGVAIGPDGKEILPTASQPTDVQMALQAAEQNDDLSESLTFFARSTDWFDLYKAYECLYCWAGGEHAFHKLGFAPKTDVKNAKATANFHRHARPNPIPVEMSRDDVRKILKVCLTAALRQVAARES